MAERIPAKISIGGKIPAELVDELCGTIAIEGVALEWGEGDFRPQSRADLLDALEEDHAGIALLSLCDDQASWGEFSELEPFLQEHGIAFTRHSEGSGEYAPETVEFRPGHDLLCLATDTSGEPVVGVSELKPVESLLSAALELLESGSRVDCWSLVTTARRVLQQQLPPELPPLEAFEIVEDIRQDEPAEAEITAARAPCFVLYNFDAEELVSTNVFDTYDEAQDVADDLHDVVVVPLPVSKRTALDVEEEVDEDDVRESEEPAVDQDASEGSGDGADAVT